MSVHPLTGPGLGVARLVRLRRQGANAFSLVQQFIDTDILSQDPEVLDAEEKMVYFDMFGAQGQIPTRPLSHAPHAFRGTDRQRGGKKKQRWTLLGTVAPHQARSG